ncbi:2-(1,2-epoxy-1,2-dihydrophenyl)acetyl-CoA isomerase [Hephaestia caeni]|uniref:2-(1,2-epoxy-1,2-dihydrophenyl)acetyl-CoA isomerase n=1 Tax=Hephaestia caeni TaxID=645617 RepID=A0A397P4K3_9SPHN|nr:enoyl-CoA hydratase-related protein [Hephaestia caeni]RIA43798.1 2-(1,2-epoxy-1,2-dihydrophenyl)acetyl-CoA isomerase [Hephaestia caeni]
MAPLLYEVEDGLAIITLNRPDQMNATSPAMRALLIEATYRAETDDAVRAVLIRGAGAHFMAGGDLREFRERMEHDPDAHRRGAEARALDVHLAILRLVRMPKPVVAAVQGAVAGMGASIMMAADIAIAADDAYVALAFTRIGLAGDCGATFHLPRLVGERRALELMLLGERIDARRAADIGLVTRIVPRADLADESEAIARCLAAGATVGLGLAKRLVRGAHAASLEEQLLHEAAAAARCAATDDHHEGVAAFLDRRAPRFEGR